MLTQLLAETVETVEEEGEDEEEEEEEDELLQSLFIKALVIFVNEYDKY
mgnify:CR=1 FL=1